MGIIALNMPVTKKLVTPIAKLIRASKLCSKAIGIVKLLTNKVRKRSVSCPLPVEACPRLVFKTVLVLDCVEHCFPDRRQSCTRHGLMHALAEHDPSCEDSGYDDSQSVGQLELTSLNDSGWENVNTILAKNEQLLAETLGILTAALKDMS